MVKYMIPLHKSENSWYHSVFTLNTEVKTHGITVYSHYLKLDPLFSGSVLNAPPPFSGSALNASPLSTDANAHCLVEQ
ncbi:hypothetical protein OUZ56_026374 [Daphnia magna]|uniref:Uncharacterized protein n=1 Tax=Daphnia magna TaxID=35525 RepID=A0ABQ9ZLM9_9CRUS|nr:hypothetical protein OUZ56_026374 [Daphnia magna]